MTEAMGKILGMAMAYGVSSLGLLLAYVNYRRRIVGADKVMTPRAWAVVAVVLLAVGAGVVIVTQLAQVPTDTPPESVAESVETPAPLPAVETAPTEPRDPWPLIGLLLPAIVFLFATWVTTALHRHFTKGPAERGNA